MIRFRRPIAGLAAAGALALTSPAFAQSDLAAFYKGKNVDLIIGAAPEIGRAHV